MKIKMAVSKGFGDSRRYLTKSGRRSGLVGKLKKAAHRAQRRAIRRDDGSVKGTERDVI